MQNLSSSDFKEKIFNYEQSETWSFKGQRPVLIDFYADWCGPCKMLAPIIEDLAKEYAGRVDIYKVDTETEQELAAVFGIRSIPSLLFIPMQGEPQMAAGAMPRQTLKDAIEGVLLKKKE